MFKRNANLTVVSFEGNVLCRGGMPPQRLGRAVFRARHVPLPESVKVLLASGINSQS